MGCSLAPTIDRPMTPASISQATGLELYSEAQDSLVSPPSSECQLSSQSDVARLGSVSTETSHAVRGDLLLTLPIPIPRRPKKSHFFFAARNPSHNSSLQYKSRSNHQSLSTATALLQTGISWDKTPHNTTYTAWYEWFPKPQVGFEDMSISAGDLIQATIHATSNTSGIATIENLSTGETAGRLFAGETSSLCGRTAEWIVEDFDVDGSLVGFADYGGVEFTGSWAVGGDGARVDAGDADLVTMVSGVGRDTLSTCAVNGTNVSCKYGPV